MRNIYPVIPGLRRVLQDLQVGASAAQKSKLLPVTVRNASSAFKHGRMLMDKITSWVNTEFVSGPFKTAPVPGIRANPLIAVVRKGAVRPIINLSSPKRASFNENVNSYSLERVHMATVRKCGKNAKMSKFDTEGTYELTPGRKEGRKTGTSKHSHSLSL